MKIRETKLKCIPTGNEKTPAGFSFGDLVDRRTITWLSLSGCAISMKEEEEELFEHYDVVNCCSSCSSSPCKKKDKRLFHRLWI